MFGYYDLKEIFKANNISIPISDIGWQDYFQTHMIAVKVYPGLDPDKAIIVKEISPNYFVPIEYP